jgi:hypothetical protein
MSAFYKFLIGLAIFIVLMVFAWRIVLKILGWLVLFGIWVAIVHQGSDATDGLTVSLAALFATGTFAAIYYLGPSASLSGAASAASAIRASQNRTSPVTSALSGKGLSGRK